MANFRLSRAAQQDIASILVATNERFGKEARLRYEKLVVAAFRDIAAEPSRIGVIDRAEFGQGVRSYHLRHSRDKAKYNGAVVRRPRHLILFREIGPDLIGIGRVLYDAMEIERHLPSDYAEE